MAMADPGGAARRMLFHLACILMLAWPAFLNNQPFYFPDTTAYTRAADSAAYVFSGHRLSTEWTDRYRYALDPGGAVRDPARHVSPNANDLGTESIMAGRSPYFGALLWIGYILSRFWLFVLAQAAASYGLIRVALRLFGLARPGLVAASVAGLALLTSLPFFVGLLMPDLLAASGILAFLLLAIDRGRLRSAERWLLSGLILMSVLSHLTHIVIIAAMTAVLLLWALIRGISVRSLGIPLGGGAMLVLAGMLSVMLTNAVVERTFGRKPLLVPLLTARFLADGSGLRYLAEHCPAAGLAACAYRDRAKINAVEFLWSHTTGRGAYMLADTETRRALSAEDSAFAFAVLRSYPFEQGWHIAHNGMRQLLRFDIDLLNYRCTEGPRCWSSLPPAERRLLRASMGGRGQWPQEAIATTHYLTVVVALLVLLAWAVSEARADGDTARDIRLWLLLLAVAVVVNALLGGSISEPQPRYQARLMWLLPFMAMIVAMRWRDRRGRLRVPG